MGEGRARLKSLWDSRHALPPHPHPHAEGKVKIVSLLSLYLVYGVRCFY